MFFLMASTAFVDVAWILYWGEAWDKGGDDSWMSVLHHVVVVLSIIELLLKLATTVIVLITEKENIIENSPGFLGNIFQKL